MKREVTLQWLPDGSWQISLPSVNNYEKVWIEFDENGESHAYVGPMSKEELRRAAERYAK